MSSDASSPRPPPPTAEAAAAATALAPGFRFHPTDEELVSYYLKRKVLAKPVAVDAIAEVDLYKVDPWDLPSRSLIQSRDMEWYFFSPLDKKYSNRSRTNRATGTGYWKTTGKDRPVKRGPRTIGMKKTLVFHIGKAPKGNRTNWVMHEYRLEDEELVRAGIPQDEYVVCRIFEKHGPGPQNGAQYGAPLVEEEWEDDGKVLVPDEQGARRLLERPGNQQCPSKFDTTEQEQENIQTGGHVLVSEDGHIKAHDSAAPTGLNEKLPQGQDIGIDVDDCETPEVNCDLTSVDVGEPGSIAEPREDCYSPRDDFLEMNDLTDPLDIEIPIIEDDGLYCNGIRNDMIPTDLFSSNDTLTEIHGVEEFFHSGEGSVGSLERVLDQSVEDTFYLENTDLTDPAACNYICGEQVADDMLCFDAPAFTSAVEYDAFVEANDFLEPLVPEHSSTDPMDEIIAYLDATEGHLGNSDFGSFSGLGETQITSEVYGKAQTPPREASETDVLEGSPSSEPPPQCPKLAKGSLVKPVGDCDYGLDKTFKGRLIGMLGSISSPPAFAAEPKDLKLTANSHPSSSGSIRITAGMICINSLAIGGDEKVWSAQKDDVSFLLSYSSVTANGIQSDSDSFAPNGKAQGGAISWAVRSGFCLSFLSVVFLAVVFKVGAYVYSR